MGIALTLLILAVLVVVAILAFLYGLIWCSAFVEDRFERVKQRMRARREEL